MKGRELRHVLVRFGLTYSEYSRMIGKSESTIQRWISYDTLVAERYIMPLRNLFTNKVFEKIEKEWIQIQIERQKQIEESLERSRRNRERALSKAS